MAYYPEQYISLTGPYHGPGPIAETNPQRTADVRATLDRNLAGKTEPGELQSDGLTMYVTTQDDTGRKIKTFTGHPAMWMDRFKAIGYIQDRINKHATPLYANGGKVTK